MTDELLKKAEYLVAKAEVATLTSVDEDGYPRTATLSNLKPISKKSSCNPIILENIFFLQFIYHIN